MPPFHLNAWEQSLSMQTKWTEEQHYILHLTTQWVYVPHLLQVALILKTSMAAKIHLHKKYLWFKVIAHNKKHHSFIIIQIRF